MIFLITCWVLGHQCKILILNQLRTTRSDHRVWNSLCKIAKEIHTASFSHSGVSSDSDSRLSVEVWGWQLLSLALMHWLKSQQGCDCLCVCVCVALSHSDRRQNKSQRDTQRAIFSPWRSLSITGKWEFNTL